MTSPRPTTHTVGYAHGIVTDKIGVFTYLDGEVDIVRVIVIKLAWATFSYTIRANVQLEFVTRRVVIGPSTIEWDDIAIGKRAEEGVAWWVGTGTSWGVGSRYGIRRGQSEGERRL
jgi:hypothetical protein